LARPGLGDVYGFVRSPASFGFGPEPVWLAQQIATGDRNAVVATAAVDNRDPACVKALQMFVEILGAEAGNAALRGMATGGVVIGGGIPPKILPMLQTGGLMARFTDKGRFASWAKSLGVRVTLEPRASLL